jgi:iron complex outermembrane recepter protein
VQGWEFSYQQQFTFLPGFLKGVSALANFTLLDTHGDFGGTGKLTSGQVAGFVPRSGNLSLSWRHRGFSTRVLWNYVGSYITSYSAASVGRNVYRFSRVLTNVGFAYQLRPSLSFTCDINNITNEPQRLYRGIPDQVQNHIIQGTSITMGVSGRF